MPTGLGGYDAQGIWQYGEDDTETLMSDLLNKGQQSTSDQLAADRARLDVVEASTAALADSGYTALTLLNSWVNFGGAYSTARYRKVGGWVELTGLIKSGTTTSSTIIANLPPGYRVASQRMFPSVTSPYAFAVLEVRPTGDITVASVGSNTYLSLEGIRFVAEA